MIIERKEKIMNIRKEILWIYIGKVGLYIYIDINMNMCERGEGRGEEGKLVITY